MSNRSIIKRTTAFIMTLAVIFPNIFTSEVINSLADSIPENFLEGTVAWNESWDWNGPAAPGSAFRPSQQGNNAFQLVLNKGEENEVTTQVNLSTDPFYIEYTGYETDNTWNYKVTNIPDDYTVVSVSIEEIPGYNAVTSANVTGTEADTLTCTADTSNTITINQDSYASQCSYQVTLTSNEDNSKTYSVNAAAKDNKVVLKIPNNFHYEISLPIQNGSNRYSLLHTNSDETLEEVAPDGEQYVIKGDTSADNLLQDVYTLNTLYESENTFAVNWEADGNDHTKTGDLQFIPYLYYEGYVANPSDENRTFTESKNNNTYVRATDEICKQLFGYVPDFSKNDEGDKITINAPSQTKNGKNVSWAFVEDPNQIQNFTPTYYFDNDGNMTSIVNKYSAGTFQARIIWEDDADTSYRNGEKIRIDLYAKSTDGSADRFIKSQYITPSESGSVQEFTFDNLQSSENGIHIEYYAKEIFENADGNYIDSNGKNYRALDGGIIRNSGEAFTNILTVKTQFTAEKEWKLTEQGKDALPGKTVLYLYRFEEDESRSEQEVASAISNAYHVPIAEGSAEIVSVSLQENNYESMSEDGKQHISLSGLDKYSKSGKKYVYFMKEVMADFQTIGGASIKYNVKYENTGNMSADNVVFDGGKLVNYPTQNVSVPVLVNWKAAATQENWKNYQYVVKLQVKKDENTFEDVDYDAYPEAKQTFNFVADKFVLEYLIARKYDENGNQLEYRAVVEKISRDETEFPIQNSVFQAEGYDYRINVSGNQQNGYNITNTLFGTTKLNINKEWINVDPIDIQVKITELDSTNKNVGSLVANINVDGTVNISDSNGTLGESYINTENYKMISQKETSWQTGYIEVPKYDSEGYEYKFSASELTKGGFGTEIRETLTDNTYTANVKNYQGSIPYENMRVKKHYVIGGDENILYDAHMVLVKNTPVDEEGEDQNQKYYFKSFDTKNNINIYTTDPSEAYQVTLNEKNNWFNTINVQYGTSDDLHFEEYSLVKDEQHSYIVDYSNVRSSSDGKKWTGATVSTDKQVYAVTIDKQSNRSYLVTNQRIGDVEATIVVKWHEGTFADETRPDVVNYTLTCSDGGKTYHLKADKNTKTVTITDDDGNETKVPLQVDNDQWSFIIGGPDEKGMALPKYTSDTAVTVSYMIEEDGLDISNKVITFSSDNGNYTAEGKSERYNASKTKYYVEASNRDHDKKTVTFEHILDKKVGKTFYKVWCDKDEKADRQSPVLTLYSTITQNPESDKDYTLVSDSVYTRKTLTAEDDGYSENYEIWKIDYESLPLLDENGNQLYYWLKETGKSGVNYAEPIYFKTLADCDTALKSSDHNNKVLRTSPSNDDTQYYNNLYQFMPTGNLKTDYAPENGCILNLIDQSTTFSMTKKWTNVPKGASAGNLKFTYALMAKFANSDDLVQVAYLEKNTLEEFTDNFVNTVYHTDGEVPLYDLYGRKITYSIAEKVTDSVNGADYTDKIFKPSVAGTTENSITINNDYMGSNNKAEIAVGKTWSGVHKGEAYPSLEVYLYRSETKLDNESEAINAYRDAVKAKNTEVYQKLTLQNGKAENDNPVVDGVFKNLLVYKPNGEKYYYYIIENNSHDKVYKADKTDALSGEDTAYCVKEIQLKKDLTDNSESATQNNVAFTNTYQRKYGNPVILNGTKTWIDYHNNSASRPDNISLKVMRSKNDTIYGAEEMPADSYDIKWTKNEADIWEYTITSKTTWELNDSSGYNWTYFVEESVVPLGYSATNRYTKIDRNKMTEGTVSGDKKPVTIQMEKPITNQLSTKFTVEKQWLGDSNNKFQTRLPVKIRLQYSVDNTTWKNVSELISSGCGTDENSAYTDIATIKPPENSNTYSASYTFEKLPSVIYENGVRKDIVYRGIEIDADNNPIQKDSESGIYLNQGYRVVDTNTSSGGLKNCVRNYLSTFNLTVEKVWVDDNNFYAQRPNSLTITLQRTTKVNPEYDASYDVNGNTDESAGWVDVKDVDGNLIQYSMSVSNALKTDSNRWQISVKDIPSYSSKGEKYQYRAVESVDTSDPYNAGMSLKNYELTQNSEGYKTTLTNTIIKKTEEYSVQKKWVNTSKGTAILELIYRTKNTSWKQYINEYGENVRVTLDGTADTNGNQLAFESSSWTATWKNLPKHDSEGNEYIYAAVEVDASGKIITSSDGYLVETNSENPDVIYNIEKTSLTIQKTWDDQENKYGLRNAPIYRIYRKLQADNTVTSSASCDYNASGWEEIDLSESITYANSDIASDLNVTATKYVIKGASVDNSVKNQVKASSTADNNSIVISNLPKYDRNGKLYEYIAIEQQTNQNKSYQFQYDGNAKYSKFKDDPSNYQEAKSSFTNTDGWKVSVTNQLITGNIAVQETFEDDADRIIDPKGNISKSQNVDVVRPKTITVQLTAKGLSKGVSSNEVSFVNYKYIWNKVPVYKNDGSNFEYQITSKEKTANTLSKYKIKAEQGITVSESDEVDNSKVTVTKGRASSSGANMAGIRIFESDSESITVTFQNVYTPQEITVQAMKKWSNKTDNNSTEIPDIKAYLVAKFKVDDNTDTCWLVPTENSGDMTKWIYLDNEWSQEKVLPLNYQIETYCKTLNSNGTKAAWGSLPKNAVNYAYTESGASPSLGKVNEVTYQVYEVVEKINSNVTYKYNNTVKSGNVFTIQNTLETVNVTIQKKWNDANDQDGKRTDSITVLVNGIANGKDIYPNGKKFTISKTQNSDSSDVAGNTWKLNLTLPKYSKDGYEIAYSVHELDADGNALSAGGNYNADYVMKSESGNMNEGFEFINQHDLELKSLTVQKQWEDANNQDGYRPESIKVQLYADGKEEGEPVTLNAENKWSHSFGGLEVNRKKANASEKTVAVVYTVKEIDLDKNYTASISKEENGKIVVTNQHKLDTRDIEVQKKWEDANDQDGFRPKNIIVQLYADGKEVSGKTLILNAQNNWKGKFENLEVNQSKNAFSIGRTEIQYTVKELDADGNALSTGNDYNSDYVMKSESGNMNEGFEFINQHTPETKSLTVQKQWEDANNQDSYRPETMQIQLYRNDEKIGEPQTLNEENGWKYIYPSLDVYFGGKVAKYSIREIREDGTEVNIGESYDGNYFYSKSEPESVSLNQNENVIVLTNKHKLDTRNIAVQKLWEDSNNQDGYRPESIKVQLYADGKEEGEPVTLNAENSWKHTFENLMVNRTKDNISQPAVPIVYTVKELSTDTDEALEDGSKFNEKYTVSYAGENSDEITIKNTHITDTREILVQKKWDDNDNQDGKRPKEITVQLYADGKVVSGKTLTLNAENDWKGKFENLEVNQRKNTFSTEKTEIQYTVKELDTNGNAVEENIVSNDGYTLASIVGSMGEGYVLTNQYVPETENLTIMKSWEDANDQDGCRPNSIQVQLYQNEEKVGTPQELTAENGWKYTFSSLAVYKKGQKAVYNVKEISEDGKEIAVGESYNEAYHYSNSEPKTLVLESNAANEIVITNTHNPYKKKITVKKIWNDDENRDGYRSGEVTVQLYADDKPTGKTENLNEENNWTASFDDLECNNKKISDTEKTVPIVYTIREQNADGNTYLEDGEAYNEFYTVSYTGKSDDISDSEILVTNTHEIEITSFSGVKTWEDADNQDGKRPNEIIVSLFGKTTETEKKKVDSQKISSDENGEWKFEFKNLPKKENGVDIIYYVEEDAVEGYNAIYQNENIINRHEPEKINISVKKVWDDANNQDGIRPNSVTVKLLADNQETGKTITLNDANHWNASFSSLDKYTDGREIIYTIEEESCEGYTPTYEGDMQNGFVITNTYEPKETYVDVRKMWDDEEDADQIRPKSIIVKLLADGKETGDTVELNSKNNWTARFSELAKNANGKKIIYTVSEETPDGYQSTVSEADENDFTITNYHKTEYASLEIKKYGVNGENVFGAVMQIQDNDGNVISIDGKKLEWTSDGDTWKIDKLLKGKYKLVELSVKNSTDGNQYDIIKNPLTFEVKNGTILADTVEKNLESGYYDVKGNSIYIYNPLKKAETTTVVTTTSTTKPTTTTKLTTVTSATKLTTKFTTTTSMTKSTTTTKLTKITSTTKSTTTTKLTTMTSTTKSTTTTTKLTTVTSATKLTTTTTKFTTITSTTKSTTTTKRTTMTSMTKPTTTTKLTKITSTTKSTTTTKLTTITSTTKPTTTTKRTTMTSMTKPTTTTKRTTMTSTTKPTTTTKLTTITSTTKPTTNTKLTTITSTTKSTTTTKLTTVTSATKPTTTTKLTTTTSTTKSTTTTTKLTTVTSATKSTTTTTKFTTVTSATKSTITTTKFTTITSTTKSTTTTKLTTMTSTTKSTTTTTKFTTVTSATKSTITTTKFTTITSTTKSTTTTKLTTMTSTTKPTTTTKLTTITSTTKPITTTTKFTTITSATKSTTTTKLTTVTSATKPTTTTTTKPTTTTTTKPTTTTKLTTTTSTTKPTTTKLTTTTSTTKSTTTTKLTTMTSMTKPTTTTKLTTTTSTTKLTTTTKFATITSTTKPTTTTKLTTTTSMTKSTTTTKFTTITSTTKSTTTKLTTTTSATKLTTTTKLNSTTNAANTTTIITGTTDVSSTNLIENTVTRTTSTTTTTTISNTTGAVHNNNGTLGKGDSEKTDISADSESRKNSQVKDKSSVKTGDEGIIYCIVILIVSALCTLLNMAMSHRKKSGD